MEPSRNQPVILGGGLDLVTPPLQVEPGRLLQVKNFECDLNNGYRVLSGYERFDGRSSPTGTDFHAVPLTSVTGWQAGETVTGGTSGATAEIFEVGAEGLYVTELSGTFTATETITGSVSGTTGTVSVVAANVTITDDEDFQDVRFNKEIYLRDKIQAVPGTGPVRGAFRHLGVVLAVRDFSETEARMYRSTSSGWEQVGTSHIIFWDGLTGDFDDLIEGVEVNDGNGNTATVIGVSRQDTGSVTGYIVVEGYTAGFNNDDSLMIDTTNVATVHFDAAEVTLSPGGKFEFVSHNYTGGEGRYRVYGCDGVNPAFEYDVVRNAIVPIYTDQANQSTDTPTFIAVYRNQLFLQFSRGLMRNSEPGNFFLWDAAAGTLEFAVGAEPTGFDVQANSLIVTTRRQTRQLLGDTSDNFEFPIAGERVGAIPYTLAHIGTTYMLDDRGIVELSRVEAFGNFENATISRLIQPELQRIRQDVIASTTVLTTNVYKLFTADGRGVSVTFQEGQVVGFGLFDLEIGVNTASTAEDEGGNERILVGSTNGFVYELERGRSFDGNEKEYWFRTAYQYLDTPLLRKKFYRAWLGLIINGTADVRINADFSLGSSDTAGLSTRSLQGAGQDSAFDVGRYDQAIFDGKVVSDLYVDLDGTGESISLILNGKSAKDDIFSLKDIMYTYKPRRQQRSAR